MSDNSLESANGNTVTRYLLDQLRRHPKRVVFTDGEDIRVIRAAAMLVEQEVVAPILLGNKDRIRALAAEHGVSMNLIHIIDPPLASDFGLFCQRVENMARYRTIRIGKPEEIVARPHYFGSLMVQYGQADAVVGGNLASPVSYFRALLHTIKPLPHVPKIFGVSILTGSHLHNLGGDGILFMADTALNPVPNVEELAAIAVETGRLARHFLGRTAHVAMLSHSTHGSATTPDAMRMAAATSLARDKSLKEFLDITFGRCPHFPETPAPRRRSRHLWPTHPRTVPPGRPGPAHCHRRDDFRHCRRHRRGGHQIPPTLPGRRSLISLR